MDIEEREDVAKERSLFNKEIEDMLEKERQYRQNNEFNHSVLILPQIVHWL